MMKRLNTLLPIVVITAYCLWVFYFAVEMPFWDDFDIYLRFILAWIEDTSPIYRAELLFTRNAEHFVVTNKIATLLDYYLFNKISLRHLITYGNILFLCGIVIFLWRKPFSPWMRLWALVLLLSPQYPQSFLWATGALENLPIFLWVVLAFLFASTGSIMTLPFFILAAFTQGNGALAALAWALTLALRGSWRNSLLWTVLGGILLGLILALPGSHQPSVASYSSVLTYMLIMLGAGVGPTPTFSAIIGGVSLLVAALVIKPTSKRDPLLTAMLLWLLATAAANALARFSFGTDYGFIQSRYRVVSLFFVVTLGIAVWELPKSATLKRISGSVAALIIITVFTFKLPNSYLEATFRRQNLEDSNVRYTLFNTGLSYPDPTIPVLRQAEQREVISITPVSHESYIGKLRTLSNAPITSGRIIQNIEWLLCQTDFLYIGGYSFHLQEPGTPIIVLLHDGAATAVVQSAQVRTDVVDHHGRPDAVRSGVRALLPTSSLPTRAGEIRLGIEQPDGTVKIAPVGKTYTLPCN